MRTNTILGATLALALAGCTGTGGSGTVTVAISGELDLSVVDELRNVLAGAGQRGGCRTVQVDLARVSFLDSTTIGALIGGQNEARRAGRHLKIMHPTDPVRRVLTVAGVLDVLTGDG